MKLLKLIPLLTLAACASKTYTVRSDDKSDRPEWASIEKATYEKDENMYFVNFVEVAGDSSKSAALNMSDEKALSDPMRAVVSEFLDQNQVGEEIRKDENFGRRIISATRGYRPPMPTLKIAHRYWEHVTNIETKQADLRAFSLASLSKVDFDQARTALLSHLRGDPEVKKILDDVGEKQRANILGSAVDAISDVATKAVTSAIPKVIQ